jgi:hypothetical protein
MNKLQKLLRLIENVACVTCEDSPLLNSVQVDNIIDESDNEVLLINWYDDEGQEFVVKFTEEGLSKAKIVGHSIFAKDHEGEESQINLYTIMPVDVQKQLELNPTH